MAVGQPASVLLLGGGLFVSGQKLLKLVILSHRYSSYPPVCTHCLVISLFGGSSGLYNWPSSVDFRIHIERRSTSVCLRLLPPRAASVTE